MGFTIVTQNYRFTFRSDLLFEYVIIYITFSMSFIHPFRLKQIDRILV